LYPTRAQGLEMAKEFFREGTKFLERSSLIRIFRINIDFERKILYTNIRVYLKNLVGNYESYRRVK